MKIKDILKKRIMVLDGAMGTAIQQYPLEEEDFRGEKYKDHKTALKGNNDVLTLTRPDIIKKIHADYYKAGADIGETNTFSSTSIAQADYMLEDKDSVYQLNYQAAVIAKEVAKEFTEKEPDKPRFVTGAMGPTNKTLSLSPDVNDPGYRAITFEELVDAYQWQAKALYEGGVDMFLIETIFDTLNAKAALFALQNLMDEVGEHLDIMVSGTITDASGRTLSGQTTEAFMISVSHVPLTSIGLNCALGAKELKQYLHVLAEKSEFFVSSHPNAGLPNEFGEYDESPEQMAEQIKEYLDDGLINIIGGCCGTTSEHIQAIAELAAKYEPRKIKSKDAELA